MARRKYPLDYSGNKETNSRLEKGNIFAIEKKMANEQTFEGTGYVVLNTDQGINLYLYSKTREEYEQ